MNNYELTLVINPILGERERADLLLKITNFIEKEEGKIGKKEDWGKKTLFYPIKKHKEGIYFLWEITLPLKSASIVDKKIKLEENIIRYLLVKKE